MRSAGDRALAEGPAPHPAPRGGASRTHSPLENIVGGEPPKRQAWYALRVIGAIGFFNYVDRMVLAAVTPAVKQEFMLSDTQIGLLSTAFAVVYAVGGLPLGHLADKYSRRIILTVAAAVWSLMTVLCGAAGSYASMLLARIGVGASEAAFMPAAFSTVSDLFAPARRHLALSLLIVATSGGVIGGLALGGWLATDYGWRWAFFMLGMPGVLLALVAYLVIEEPRRGGMDVLPNAEEPTPLFATVQALRNNPLFIWLSLTNGLNAFCVVGIVQWLPSFFDRVYGLPLSIIGLIFGVAFGAGLMLGQLVGGAIATRLARRGMFEPVLLCVISNALVVCGFLVVLWVPNARVAIVATLLTTFVGSLGHAAQNVGVQNAVSARQRGVAQAITSLLVSVLGMAVAPLVVGVISDTLLPYVGSAEALRYALTLPQVLFVLATMTALRAYREGRERDMTLVRG